jgi:hypothetical protein
MKHVTPTAECVKLLNNLKFCLTKADHAKLRENFDAGWLSQFWNEYVGEFIKKDIHFLIDFFETWLEVPGYTFPGVALRTFYSLDYPNHELVFKLTDKLFEVMVDEKTKEARKPTIRRFHLSFDSDSWRGNRVETIRLAVQVIQLSCKSK